MKQKTLSNLVLIHFQELLSKEMKPQILIWAIALLFLTASCEKDTNPQAEFEKASESEKWHWVQIPGMRCRDNSNTGIGVRVKGSSKKLLIYLEGGGGCFNDVTCAVNPATYGQLGFDSWKLVGLQLGIFDKGLDLNPFKDWNWVYIPYCTGDVHSGTNEYGDAGALYKNQKMVGHNNIALALQEIQAYYGTSLDEVFLTGSSAGGYGTLINANQVIEAFPQAKATVLDDSGPVLMDQAAQPDCLDNLWANVFETHKPADFADFTTGQYTTSMKSIYEYLSNKHPQASFGIISAMEDLVIREFYGYGSNNCAATTVVPEPIPAQVYRDALVNLRDDVFSKHTNWKTFYVDDASHTFNLLPGSFGKEVGGVRFVDWINDLRNGAASHVHD